MKTSETAPARFWGRGKKFGLAPAREVRGEVGVEGETDAGWREVRRARGRQHGRSIPAPAPVPGACGGTEGADVLLAPRSGAASHGALRGNLTWSGGGARGGGGRGEGRRSKIAKYIHTHMYTLQMPLHGHMYGYAYVRVHPYIYICRYGSRRVFLRLQGERGKALPVPSRRLPRRVSAGRALQQPHADGHSLPAQPSEARRTKRAL